LLSVINISKSFHYKPVLKNIRFSMSPGETVALIGKNGAGKSTLLRIMAKISTPEEGQIKFNGKNILNGDASNRKGIYYCGHAPGMYPSLTASENLYYFSALHGYKSDLNKINSTLQNYDLSNSVNVPVKVYSQGMMQRLKLALLEIIDWSLLLIDEPFNGLDFGGQQFVIKKMDAWQDGKRSIIFVDHDIERILKIASRIIILNQHSIALDEQVDSPELKSKMKKLLN
jgi:heme exporter protein A